MITAERLEELIKQGATIWYGRNRWGYPIKLDTKHFVIVNGTLRYHKNKMLIGDGYESKDLREDVDQGKWERKMFLSRTERFEPPMWEDIEDYSFRFVGQKQFILLDIHKDDDDESDMSYIHIYNFTDNCYIFYKIGDDATKENYIKACEIARELFHKGGVM